MERCECLPLNSKFTRKSVLVKTKTVQQTVFSINQLFKVLSTGTNTRPQPWTPLINGLDDDALLELSLAFTFLQGSMATLFRWSWKILRYFVANFSKTFNINFYQDRSSIVEVITKKCWCFYASWCRYEKVGRTPHQVNRDQGSYQLPHIMNDNLVRCSDIQWHTNVLTKTTVVAKTSTNVAIWWINIVVY